MLILHPGESKLCSRIRTLLFFFLFFLAYSFDLLFIVTLYIFYPPSQTLWYHIHHHEYYFAMHEVEGEKLYSGEELNYRGGDQEKAGRRAGSSLVFEIKWKTRNCSRTSYQKACAAMWATSKSGKKQNKSWNMKKRISIPSLSISSSKSFLSLQNVLSHNLHEWWGGDEAREQEDWGGGLEMRDQRGGWGKMGAVCASLD